MKSISFFAVLAFLAQWLNSSGASGATVTITGQSAGPTPFISQLNATVSPAESLKTVQFTITPKQGSVTRPISATYTSAYLQSRGYLNPQTGKLVVPVFGLYANYANTILLKSFFTDNSTQQNSVVITTPGWVDPCLQFNNPTVIQARTSSTSLSYDYFLIKNICGFQSPVLMDSDGAVRWVGTAGLSSTASMFFANGIYISAPPSNSSRLTGIARMELDGTISFLQDYSGLGVTGEHHNFDPGKEGILVEVDTSTHTESVIIEVDALGAPLHMWNLANIISAAMTAGGDDPRQLVRPAPDDWFHNNAATYRKSDDSLIVSSRENFVICLDYEKSAIRWILGDPTKAWYQFPSLRRYSLGLGTNTLPPIGQHAVSISKDNNLLLFDDGQNSLNQSPAGTQRNYSVPRKYHIDAHNRIASEVWNYSPSQTLFSPFCSSVYEDAPSNYLIDYTIIRNLGTQELAELMGLDSTGNKVFDYRYSTTGCATGWNAIPIHLESIVFATVDPVAAVSRKIQGRGHHYDIDLPFNGTPGVESRSGGVAGDYQVVFSFAKPVTASAAEVQGRAGSQAQTVGRPTVNGNEVTVNLTQVGPSEALDITLFGVSDGTNLGTASVQMNVILADVNGDGVVDTADLNLTRRRRSKRATASNFRADVTADGTINKADQALVTANLGRMLGP
jgi:arylsulfate sulfotransferase